MAVITRSPSPFFSSVIDLHRFCGNSPGPRLLFLGGVHGEERPGSIALDALVAALDAGKLKLLKGELHIAPPVETTSDMDADIRRLRGMFCKEMARYPEKFAELPAGQTPSQPVAR